MTTLRPMAQGQLVIAIRGMRRVGKTTLLRQLAYDLIGAGEVVARDVLFIDFEAPAIAALPANADTLESLFTQWVESQSPGSRPLLILDEIQNIVGWARWVREAQETRRASVFVTGSSSRLLDDEMATVLTGRLFQLALRPLLFEEFLALASSALGRTIDRNLADEYLISWLRRYLELGGLPGPAAATLRAIDGPFAEARHDEMLRQTFRQILHDILRRHALRRPDELEQVASYLLSQTAQLSSYDSVRKKLGIGIDQVRRWSLYLEEAFLVRRLPRLHFKASVRRRSPDKVHAGDLGLRNAAAVRSSPDLGHLAETAVHNALLQRVGRQLFYWQDGCECDLVVKRGALTEEVLQVSVGTDDQLPERELAALVRAAQALHAERATLVTWRRSGRRLVDGLEVESIPLFRWLLREGDWLAREAMAKGV